MYLSFCTWLTSLKLILSTSIRVIARTGCHSFYEWFSTLTIHQLTDSSFFHVLAILSSAMNTEVQVSLTH